MKTPLHYQMTEYDCGPITVMNAIIYLFDREQIPPDLIRNIMLYCLDGYGAEGAPGKSGTTRAAMMFLSNFLCCFGRTGQLDISSNIWDDIHDGMYRVVQTHDQFNGLGVEVAGKTGTAEIDYYHPNNALFVGYAPVSEPKYAISVRIANGYASGNACLAANDIFKYIFGLADESTILTGYAASDTSNVSND